MDYEETKNRASIIYAARLVDPSNRGTIKEKIQLSVYDAITIDEIVEYEKERRKDRPEPPPLEANPKAKNLLPPNS